MNPAADEARSDTPGATEPLDRGAAEELARTLRAVADPTRLQLLSMIAGSPAQEATVGELAVALGLTQPTVTHHVRIMVDDGLLIRHPRGRNVWLTIAPARREAVRDLLR